VARSEEVDSARRDVATPIQKNDRLAPPLIYAFRAAHRDRDAAVPVDIRDQGDRVIASRRAAARTPISETELRKLVNSDLVALFNTTNLEAIEDLSSAPEVRKSIINFGFPDLTRRTIEENEVRAIAGEIESALRDFEPRLTRKSIRARRDDTVTAEALRVRFLVSAELRAYPVNVQAEFVAEVEVDSGKIRIDRL
jgi:type VI secretion system protein ImpF